MSGAVVINATSLRHHNRRRHDLYRNVSAVTRARARLCRSNSWLLFALIEPVMRLMLMLSLHKRLRQNVNIARAHYTCLRARARSCSLFSEYVQTELDHANWCKSALRLVATTTTLWRSVTAL